MKKLLSLTALGLALSLGLSAQAAEDKAPTMQQTKMAMCNADEKAKTLKGDERKAFMKECLSSNKQEKQQTKMKTCNADEKAKTLKGDERKAFMSECLKNK